MVSVTSSSLELSRGVASSIGWCVAWRVCGVKACVVQCACLVWVSVKPWRTAWASRLQTPWAPYVFKFELKPDCSSSNTSYNCHFLLGPHIQLGRDPQFKRQCCPGLSWEVDVLFGRLREFRWIGGSCDMSGWSLWTLLRSLSWVAYQSLEMWGSCCIA